MQLEHNEYTIKGFITYLEKKYGAKITGKPFNSSDVCQYEMRGYLPFRYGGNKIIGKTIQGIKIIALSEGIMKLNKKKRNNVSKKNTNL
jgi:hypothetical protein